MRLSEQEAKAVDRYLARNPIFDSFSSLARVATLSFINEGHRLDLHAVSTRGEKRRPGFLWDYDLSEAQVREILSQPGLSENKRFLMQRILSECRYEDVFDYLTYDDLSRHFEHLTLPETKKRHWAYALSRWSRARP